MLQVFVLNQLFYHFFCFASITLLCLYRNFLATLVLQNSHKTNAIPLAIMHQLNNKSSLAIREWLDDRGRLKSNKRAQLLMKSNWGRNRNCWQQSKRESLLDNRSTLRLNEIACLLMKKNWGRKEFVWQQEIVQQQDLRTGPTIRTRLTEDCSTTRACSSWNSTGSVGSLARGGGKSQQLDETRKAWGGGGDNRVGTCQSMNNPDRAL